MKLSNCRYRGRTASCLPGAATVAAALLAGLTWTVPAAAQSSVTLYGAIDTSLEVTSPGRGYVTRLDSGAYRGSRIGLRGVEDLGSGVKLLFDLENGFGSDDGSMAVANTIFNRQAWIGVGSDAGTLRVGRQYSPIYIPFKGQLDAFGAGTIASGLNNLSKITPYQDNAITYIAPEIKGFSGALQTSLRDPSDNDGSGLAGTVATLGWRNGDLHLSYAHQQMHGSSGLMANLAGASYQIGSITWFMAYFNGDSGSAYHNDGASLSARYAFSPRMRASLGYTYLLDRSGSHNNADQFSAAWEFDLSKTVLLYTSAGWLRNHGKAVYTLRGVNVTGVTPSEPGATVRGVQFGIIKRF